MSWNVLVVDDEPNVQEVTALALARLTFEDFPIKLYFASSAESAIESLHALPGIAVILLDVVMEHDASGLELISYVRDTLKNPFVRFILRTGQAGIAPESEIMQTYDIQEYWNKVDLTVKRLRNAVISALRSYTALARIERRRKVGEFILKQSEILQGESVDADKFIELVADSFTGILSCATALTPLHADQGRCLSALILRGAESASAPWRASAGRGHFAKWAGSALDEIPDEAVRETITAMIARDTPILLNEDEGVLRLLLTFRAPGAAQSALYLQGSAEALDSACLMTLATHAQAVFRAKSAHWVTQRSHIDSAFQLASIVEHRLGGDDGNLQRLSRQVRLLALKAGLGAVEAALAAQGAIMHDVGKIKIADAVLMKTNPLTPEEWSVIKTHPILGHELLASSQHEQLRACALTALDHHERWDGSGYPNGKQGVAIDIGARLTAIIDVHDRMISDRPYRPALAREAALAFIRDGAGKLFDPQLARCFLDAYDDIYAVYDEFPINHLS